MPANHYRQQVLKKKQQQQQRSATKARQEQQQLRDDETALRQETMESLGFSSFPKVNNVNRKLFPGYEEDSEDDEYKAIYGRGETASKTASPLDSPLSGHSRFLDVSGLRGITNLGNTCFMNAALQALSHITPLRMYFIRTYFRRLRTQVDITADGLFDNFIRAMWAPAPSDREYIDPFGLSTETISPIIAKSMVAFMWKRFPFLHPGDQHDAQEFLRCFLNELHDSLKTVDLRSTPSSLIEQRKQEELQDMAVRRGVWAERAKAKYLANELLSLSPKDSSRKSQVYREKLDQFIQMTDSLAEQPSESEDEDCDLHHRHYRRQHCCSTGEPISGCTTAADTTSSGSDCPSCESTANSDQSCCSSCNCSCSATPAPSTPAKHLGIANNNIAGPSHSQLNAAAAATSCNYRRASLASSSTPGTTSLGSNRIQSRSIISDIFTGELENTIRCTVCDNVSVQIESFQDLSIPISIIDKAIQTKYKNATAQGARRLTTTRPSPSAIGTLTHFWPFGTDLLYFYYNYFWSWLEWFSTLITAPTVLLDDCLDMFFNPEMLENENRYSCENCHKLCNGVKCIRIKRLPEVLTIHLNRYQNVNSSLHKITSNLQFPLVDLDVGKYMSESNDCTEKAKKDKKQVVANYELVAVVCHAGSQITNGHYTCYALNDVNFEWYEYDDIRVRYVSSEEVQTAAGSNAYILFYQRTTDNDNINGSPASRTHAAISVCADLEQMWLEQYWKPTQGSSDPLRDYYFFSQNQSNLITCFNNNNSTSFANFTEATLNEQSVTISKYWLNLFLTCMEPGPIDNSDIFCPHRRIRPTEWMYFNTMAVPLIEPVGQLLYALYGGGPVMSRLYGPDDSPICQCCADQLNQLRYRRSEEYARFQMLQSVTGLVFKKLKLRKADSVIEFEMLGEPQRPDEGPDGQSGNGVPVRGSLDVMDSLDDTELDVELNCSQPILTEETVITTVKEGKEEQDTISVDQVESDQEMEHQESAPAVKVTQPAVDNGPAVEEGRQIIVPNPPEPINLYEAYPVEEEPTHYYLISAEWLQQWFNFINVDFGDVTNARNRQLLAIYQKITDTSGYKSSNGSPYRHHLNPHLEGIPDSDFHFHLPHPPFSSLLKPPSAAKEGATKNFELDQLWSQIDFNMHTIVPPGPIDNWSLFGIKRKLLMELRKKGKKTASEPNVTNYNDLVNLLATSLGGEAVDVFNLDSGITTNSIEYNFYFTARTHGGISEENRSCLFYLLSPEYWEYFSTIYGGGPVFTFDYQNTEQKFNVRIRVSDVEHFIRDHYKGTIGMELALNSAQLTTSSSIRNIKRTGSIGQRPVKPTEEPGNGPTLRRRTVSACTASSAQTQVKPTKAANQEDQLPNDNMSSACNNSKML